jgi:L-2-hydroxyglutarate oxidase LhgO
MHDIVIIGGGISSLYAAYKLLQKNSELSILLLEKESHLGGRTWKEKFNTSNVVVGAGVLRAKKIKFQSDY